MARRKKTASRGTKRAPAARGRKKAAKKATRKKAARKTAAKKAPARKKQAARKAKKVARKAATRKAKKVARKAAPKRKAAARKKAARKASRTTTRKKVSAKKVSARKVSAKKKSPTRKKAARKVARKKVVRKKSAARKKTLTRKAGARRRASPARARRNLFRLDESVVPLGYTLALELDPSQGKDYHGLLQIDIELNEPAREIELHAADLRILDAKIEYGFSSTPLDDEPSPPADDPSPTEAAMSDEAPVVPTTEPAPPTNGQMGGDDSSSGPSSFQIGGHPSILEVPPSGGPAGVSNPVASSGVGGYSGSSHEAAAVERQLEPTPPAPETSSPESGLAETVAEPHSPVAELETSSSAPASTPSVVEAIEPLDDEPAVTLVARAKVRPETQTVLLQFPEEVPAGVATLDLEFEGALRDDLRGLYHAKSGDHAFAFTQLEPVDARRFFPCFDEPSLKAPLQLSVRTHQDHTVISNAPVETVHFEEGGHKTVHFQPTQPLPSYLYALAVGPLEGSESRYVGDTELRVWHAPGKGHLSAFGSECAAESLARLETYFDIAYPYEKLDLVAVPDFEIGAMENAGAVFFRETLLLLDPESATAEEKKRAAEVIAHELAHMWFGDLVTMRWWDDLWLKESFATWMAYKIIDQWQPGYRMWNRFLGDREDALELDALTHTHSVYTEVQSPEEATEHFDAITYEKGASVVRMIERYLGEDAFRDGVRLYLQRHAGGVAEAADLWGALAESSGQSVDSIVKAWVTQEGHPLLRIKRRPGDGNVRLVVSQERFCERPAPRTGKPAKVSGKWPVPFLARVGLGEHDGPQLQRNLLDRAREEVELDSVDLHFVYGNAEEAGFWRVLHDPSERENLLANREHLDALERYGLVSHTWAAVRAGHCEITELLDVVEALADETDADVLACVVGALQHVRRELVVPAGPEVVDAFQRWLVDRFAPAMIELGWEAREGEDEDVSLRRAQVLSLLADVAQWAPVSGELADLFAAYLDDTASVDPNIADLVVRQAAATADEERYDALLDAYENAETPQLAVRYLRALCACRDKKLVRRTLELSLTPRIPTQDVARTYIWLLQNSAAQDAAWAFLSSRWKKVSTRLTPSLVSRVVDATPSMQSPRAKSAVRQHFKAHPVPTAAQSLRRAMERFDIGIALRRRAVPLLKRWAKEL